MRENIGRSHPPQGVYIFRDRPTIVFVTVCEHGRKKVLARHQAHQALLAAWHLADAWLVGNYVIMPDHVHFFCAPHSEDYTLEHWVTFWKRLFKRSFGPGAPSFQSHSFHHRLRRGEDYREKWEYVRANPIRAGLAAKSEDWPFQGMLHQLRW